MRKLVFIIILFLVVSAIVIINDCRTDLKLEAIKDSIMQDKPYNEKLDINKDGKISAMDYVKLKEKYKKYK